MCLAGPGISQCLKADPKRRWSHLYPLTIPYWNPKVSKSPICHITCAKNNGDLLDLQNVVSIVKRLVRNVFQWLQERGFDTTDDYNRQEELSYPLILSEVLIALKIQSLGGTFVCKLFDTFLPSTLQLMDILTRCYETVSCYKPCMSRLSNSEKYIVCQGYKGTPNQLINTLTHQFCQTKQKVVWNTSQSFIESVSRYNHEYVDAQCHSITKGVTLIKENKLQRKPTSQQVVKGKEWCKKHGLVY